MSEFAGRIFAELNRVDYAHAAISPFQILNDNYDYTLKFRFLGNRLRDDRFDACGMA
jgi:hypothetical protein